MTDLDRDREHVLEAVLMASERGRSSLEDARGIHRQTFGDDVVASLEEDGFLVRREGHIHLTEQGAEAARGVVRRHRLVEVLLHTVFELDAGRTFDLSCRMEHDLPREMVEAFCTLLGHPDACPHGRPIPPGPCCKHGVTTVERQVVPLTELKPGERGRVLFMRTRTHHSYHKLVSLGLTPGVTVELHQRKPAFCLRFEGTELALDRQVAEDIHVVRLG